jgi:hypothetical protein
LSSLELLVFLEGRVFLEGAVDRNKNRNRNRNRFEENRRQPLAVHAGVR